jgi:glc operon protein GlcG
LHRALDWARSERRDAGAGLPGFTLDVQDSIGGRITAVRYPSATAKIGTQAASHRKERHGMAHLRDVRALTLEGAKAMAEAAERLALERGWTVAVAVVDAAGGLILFHCLDETQPASQDIAVLKARTAARLHRPTKALEDTIAGGRVALLSVPNMLSLEGGLPVRVNNKVIGAIGVSGMTSPQDAEVAAAGVAAFRRNP